ncbi:hypothetical protein J6590_098349 [Homalodisca vitripennis]|nr:hypothetical protein J6590_098349 [Homalodisca vitripennis]
MNDQNSSIYPHLYVVNTIDLPQYFTGGFLQQDPVSHLERPEEYVPQLGDMEKITGYTDELEQSLISITEGDYHHQQHQQHQQPPPPSSTHVFAKPSPRVHGGKRMPVAVKKISRNDRPPTVATDDEHSDRGEEVQSPVAPTDSRDNNRKGSDGKKRKRASSMW